LDILLLMLRGEFALLSMPAAADCLRRISFAQRWQSLEAGDSAVSAGSSVIFITHKRASK
jgi:hypothetical protein